jgi:hypothetical protein
MKNVRYLYLYILFFSFLFVKIFSVSSVFSVIKKRQTYKVEDQVPPATHSLRALIFYL